MPRKRSAARGEDYYPEQYGFEVLELQPDYSFSARPLSFEPGPYRETLIIRLRLGCLIPRKLEGVEVGGYLYARPLADLMRERAEAGRTLLIGSLEIGKRRNAFSAVIPAEAAWGLLAGLGSGIAKYVLLTGAPLYRAQANITAIDFLSRFDPEEF